MWIGIDEQLEKTQLLKTELERITFSTDIMQVGIMIMIKKRFTKWIWSKQK